MKKAVVITLGMGLALMVPWLEAGASGEKGQVFTAKQACEAFVSKIKRTNPDNLKLTVGQQYEIIGYNRPERYDWVQLDVKGESAEERWVPLSCGTVPGSQQAAGGSGGSDSCNTPGQADSHVLALSWQPAFCETEAGQTKSECKERSPSSYQATHFTLHGLWPNKQSCGISYGFCGPVKNNPSGGMCNYPPVELNTSTIASLAEVMPSVNAGTCLDRHEWFKHGTCEGNLSEDAYFTKAANLVGQFNNSGMSQFMANNVGKQVVESDFYAQVDKSLGKGASKRLSLTCKKGNLMEVDLRLPKVVDEGQSLSALISRVPASNKTKSNCGGHFRVDPIGPN